MDRFNEDTADLIDLGSATGETKGLPLGDIQDTAGPRYDVAAGLSND